jgi:hypothetical protein
MKEAELARAAQELHESNESEMKDPLYARLVEAEKARKTVCTRLGLMRPVLPSLPLHHASLWMSLSRNHCGRPKREKLIISDHRSAVCR